MYVCDTNGFHSLTSKLGIGRNKTSELGFIYTGKASGLHHYKTNMESSNIVNKSDKRTEWMHIRLTPKEADKLRKQYEKTTSKDLSNYIRKVLLEKPITVFTRNKPLDEFVQEMILLKNELSAIGSNVNQQAKKINSYATTPSLKIMMESFQLLKDKVDGKLTEIRDRLNQFSDTWLQESSAEKASGEQ
jgi:hypothetical protein